MEYATLGDPGREVVFTIDANHTDMVRFWGNQDPNYDTVAVELNTFVVQDIPQGGGKQIFAIGSPSRDCLD